MNLNINITNQVYSQIIQYAKQQLPHEACGAMFGNQLLQSIDIHQFIPLSNTALNPENEYRIDEREWIQLLYNGSKPGQQIIGLIHSHPITSAIPSFADLGTQWHTIPSHWIISLRDVNNPILKAFSFHADGTFEHLNWTILN